MSSGRFSAMIAERMANATARISGVTALLEGGDEAPARGPSSDGDGDDPVAAAMAKGATEDEARAMALNDLMGDLETATHGLESAVERFAAVCVAPQRRFFHACLHIPQIDGRARYLSTATTQHADLMSVDESRALVGLVARAAHGVAPLEVAEACGCRVLLTTARPHRDTTLKRRMAKAIRKALLGSDAFAAVTLSGVSFTTLNPNFHLILEMRPDARGEFA